MEHVLNNKSFAIENTTNTSQSKSRKCLCDAEINIEYVIKDIATTDEELKSFLFTLGCYEGVKITLISILSENYIINVKDARYSIGQELAETILI